jgi:hypothetical protein
VPFFISESGALFSGQYDDPAEVGYLGQFEADEVLATQQVRLLLPDGSPLPKGQFLGRGRHLYLFDDFNVYRASLS